MIWDSYERFFTWAKNVKKGKNTYKELFLKFGIENTIFLQPQKAHDDFLNFSNQLNGTTELHDSIFVRKGSKDTDEKLNLHKDLYALFFQNIPIEKYQFGDNHCNAVVLETATFGTATNFQCSHIFERSKNPLAYTAKWNFAYTPKMFDPLTGHESTGIESVLFKILFQGVASALHRKSIDAFNKIVTPLQTHVSNFCDKAIANQLLQKKGKNYIEKQWEPIAHIEFGNCWFRDFCADLKKKPKTERNLPYPAGFLFDLQKTSQNSIDDAFKHVCEKLHWNPAFKTVSSNEYPDIVMVKFRDL